MGTPIVRLKIYVDVDVELTCRHFRGEVNCSVTDETKPRSGV